jgi:hypothetical protein
MNIEELQEALESILPNGFSIEPDKHGQLIIFTNFKEDEDGELLPIEDEDVDPDADPDLDLLEEDDDDE